MPVARALLPLLMAAGAASLLCGVLPAYWLFLATSLLIWAIALQGLGLVSGRAGMIALCQMSFAGVGAWTVGGLNVLDCPGGLAAWVLLGGLAAVPFGLLIGLPALRLRGIHLAIASLSFAVAFDSVLATISFPGQTGFLAVARPEAFSSDAGYFVFVLLVFTLIALALECLAHTRLGLAWLALRHDERAAAAHGISIAQAKLSAFALSAFIAGIAGGLLAGYLGTLLSDNFNMLQSLVLFAVATLAGAHFAEGALIGGLLLAFTPELLRRVGLAQDLGSVIFALGATQALSSGTSLSAALRHALRARFLRKRPEVSAGSVRHPEERLARSRADRPGRDRPAAAAALQVDDLTVRYGELLALRSVQLCVPQASVVGLIGPNGAGKSTLLDAISGFLPNHGGRIALEGQVLEGLSAHQRARRGVRRTWQTTRIAPELSVAGYLRLAAGTLSDDEMQALLDGLGCADADCPVSSLDAGTRRLLDVAGAVAARPAIVLLDEPAAGQSADTLARLAGWIAGIPQRFGSAVLLVEHDMELVRASCSAVTVLDFGCVIAQGETAAVLDSPGVRAAYLGVMTTDATCAPAPKEGP